MLLHTPTDPRPAVHHPSARLDDFEPPLRAVGTFATGQSSVGEYRVAAEAPVGSFASGLTADDRPDDRPEAV